MLKYWHKEPESLFSDCTTFNMGKPLIPLIYSRLLHVEYYNRCKQVYCCTEHLNFTNIFISQIKKFLLFHPPFNFAKLGSFTFSVSVKLGIWQVFNFVYHSPLWNSWNKNLLQSNNPREIKWFLLFGQVAWRKYGKIDCLHCCISCSEQDSDAPALRTIFCRKVTIWPHFLKILGFICI